LEDSDEPDIDNDDEEDVKYKRCVTFGFTSYWKEFYRAFHGFVQAKFPDGGLVLGFGFLTAACCPRRDFYTSILTTFESSSHTLWNTPFNNVKTKKWCSHEIDLMPILFYSPFSETSKVPIKRKVSKKNQSKEGSDLSKLDENAKEVAIKFKNGCECHDQNCFKGNFPLQRQMKNVFHKSQL